MNDKTVVQYRLKAWRPRHCLRPSRHRALAPLTILFLAVSSGLTSAAPTLLQPSSRNLALTYEVYAGGLHVFSFDVNLSLQPEGYRIAAAGSTKGITGFFYSWNVKLAAQGAHLQPARYVTVNTGRHPTKTMQLDFNKGGSFTVTRDPPETPGDESPEEAELPSSLPINIADPLSAGLVASQALAKTGSCEQTIPVFDGKRRYNLLLHDAGKGEVPKSRISIYNGPAVLCGFTMERISGFRKQPRYVGQWNEDKDEPPILWVAKVREDMPPIPVRFTGAVSLGAIVIHLTKIEPGPEISSTGLP